ATSIAKTGAGTWILSSATGNVYAGSTTVSAGNLIVQGNILNTSATTISGGTMQLAAGGGSNRILRTGTLGITGTGKLDIGDNKVIVTAASSIGTVNTANTYSGVTGLIQTGRGTGSWNGASGIVTSQTVATSSNFNSIGVALGSEVKGIASTATAVWAGQTVSGSQTLVMYTYGGDANLDGKINVDDYGRIDFAVPLGIAGWSNGDFNYDGKINVDDYGIIDFNVGIQGAAFPTGSGTSGSPALAATVGSTSGLQGVTAVPEPASLSVLAVGAMSVLAGRRRRRRVAAAN